MAERIKMQNFIVVAGLLAGCMVADTGNSHFLVFIGANVVMALALIMGE